MRYLIALLFLLNGTASRASVWQDMQNGDLSTQKARVLGVQQEAGELLVELEGSNGRERICAPANQDLSEEMRAAHFQTNLTYLMRAKQSRKSVEFQKRGPWSPCISLLL